MPTAHGVHVENEAHDGVVDLGDDNSTGGAKNASDGGLNYEELHAELSGHHKQNNEARQGGGEDAAEPAPGVAPEAAAETEGGESKPRPEPEAVSVESDDAPDGAAAAAAETESGESDADNEIGLTEEQLAEAKIVLQNDNGEDMETSLSELGEAFLSQRRAEELFRANEGEVRRFDLDGLGEFVNKGEFNHRFDELTRTKESLYESAEKTSIGGRHRHAKDQISRWEAKLDAAIDDGDTVETAEARKHLKGWKVEHDHAEAAFKEAEDAFVKNWDSAGTDLVNGAFKSAFPGNPKLHSKESRTEMVNITLKEIEQFYRRGGDKSLIQSISTDPAYFQMAQDALALRRGEKVGVKSETAAKQKKATIIKFPNAAQKGKPVSKGSSKKPVHAMSADEAAAEVLRRSGY